MRNKCMPQTWCVTWSAGSHSLSRPWFPPVAGNFTPEWVGGTVFSLPTSPSGAPVLHPWGELGEGVSSLPGTPTTASRPQPPCTAGRRMLQLRGRDQQATPAPIGCLRERQHAIGRCRAGAGPGSCGGGGAAGRQGMRPEPGKLLRGPWPPRARGPAR